MQLTDLVVEVRDPNFQRVGQLLGPDLVGATFVSRFNNVGSWQVSIPNGRPMAELLRQPGYGLVVLGPGGVIISGPTLSAQLIQSTEDPQGYWEINGADDSLILEDRLAYPSPAEADVSLQTQSHDTRTGFAETVIKGYVNDNIGPDAPAERKINNLTIEPDLARGGVVFASARFNTLQELIYDLATSTGLGFTVEQNDLDLEFKIYEPTDRSAFIRMDIANNQLISTDYSYSAPSTTRAIVGGAGEAVERLFIEATTLESEEAENVWKRRIETFIDYRGSESEDELLQSAESELVENGSTIVNISVQPTDDSNMRYGFDWNLGDRVTVVIDETEAVSVVTEVGISVQADGVRVAATVGNPVAIDFDSKLIKKTADQDERISNLERNTTGYGVNTNYQPEGGTDGTQPTFSGPAISGSYNRFGNMVHFSIDVDFDNITSFGTGQYYLTLPYLARNNYDFRDGCLHSGTGIQYHISGHVVAGSDQLWLFSSDKIASGIQDVAFTPTFPMTLTTAGNFHIAGTYEIEG